VTELLELQRTHERRDEKWKDHVGHLRQVEHALLGALTTHTAAAAAAATDNDQKPAALVARVYLFL